MTGHPFPAPGPAAGGLPARPGISPTVRASRRHRADVRFLAAQVRLINLIQNGSLIAASRDAYAHGLAALGRRPSARPPLHALARISLAEPETGDAAVRLPLRWSAATAAGLPLIVLEGDLTMAPLRSGRTVLGLDAGFRLPFVITRPSEDVTALVERAAAAALRLLLTQFAASLSSTTTSAVNSRPGSVAT
jgi:hypothetical protein